MKQNLRLTAGLIAAAALLLPLTGCAPEPGTVSPDGTPLTEKHEPEGGSWPEKAPEEALKKTTELPEGFPQGFVVPEGSVIDDAGERAPGSWFVVLRAADATAADALWTAVISGSGFEVSDESEANDGRSATLTGNGLSVQALTLPGDDGGVLLSYDVASAV